MPPPGPQLGPCSAGSPTRGPMGCPGGRQGRAHPAHRRIEQRQRPCRRYGPAPEHPDLEPGASGRSSHYGPAPPRRSPSQERLGVEGHRDGPRAAGESLARPCGPPDRRSCGLPVLLPHDWANMGQLGRSGSSRQQCGHTRSIPRSAQPAPVAPTYTTRSDGSGPNWETLRPQVGPGVVTRTRPPDSAAGLRADGQTREAREST